MVAGGLDNKNSADDRKEWWWVEVVPDTGSKRGATRRTRRRVLKLGVVRRAMRGVKARSHGVVRRAMRRPEGGARRFTLCSALAPASGSSQKKSQRATIGKPVSAALWPAAMREGSCL